MDASPYLRYDNLENFLTLTEKSFEFWKNKKDDVYQNFQIENPERSGKDY